MDGGNSVVQVGVSPAQQWEWALHAYQRGQTDRARQALEPLLAQPDGDGESVFLGGLVEAQGARYERAATLLEDAVARAPERVERWLALASVQRKLGRGDKAVQSFGEVLARQPRHAPALNDLGATYHELGRYREALTCHEEALAIAPDFADALRARPCLLARLRQPAAAREAYEDLLARWPDEVALRLEFAEFLERSNRIDEAEAQLPSSGRRLDSALTARSEALRARLLVRRGSPELALEVLAAARRGTRANWLSYREGQLLHEAGRPDDAMRAFRRGNAARAREWRFRRLRGDGLAERLDQKIRAGFAPADPSVTADGRAAPVFLVGLPRSGTTLLDRMLGAHPDIQVLEEPVSLGLAEQALEQGASASEARAVYWDHIDGFGLDERPVIVDKNPLHAMHLDVLARIFPDAPVIVLLRHPYDAALSCYMQDFDPNSASLRFLDLDATGALCSQLLTLMRQYEQAFPERALRVHYEQLVADFRGELTRVLTTVGRQWDEQVAEFAARTGFVTTPSYEQVTRGVYDDSIGRWRDYAHWLAPVRQTVGPLLPDLGYDD